MHLIPAAVRSKRFVAVCHGVTDAILPGLNTSNVPHVNMVPTGPHPAGSYEVWVPREYLADLLSFMLIRREVMRRSAVHLPTQRRRECRAAQELTILLHPLTEYAVEDHTVRAATAGTLEQMRHSIIRAATTRQGRATFFGPPMRINLNALSDGGDPAQYPELGLGYSAMTRPTAART